MLQSQDDCPFLKEAAQILVTYQATCPSPDAVTLSQCCTMAASLEKITGKMSTSADSVRKVEWVDAFESASKRFGNLLNKHAPQWILAKMTEKGPDAAFGYVNGCSDLPESLKPYTWALMQVNFLEGLEIPTDTADLAQLTQQCKSYVTVKTSLSGEVVQTLFPTHCQKLDEHQVKAAENIIKAMHRVQKVQIKGVQTVLETGYRTGSCVGSAFEGFLLAGRSCRQWRFGSLMT